MEQLRNYTDNRLLDGCVYCGNGSEETRDHVPSKVLLDQPYPTNLPIVPACSRCNNSFSMDEEYLACLVECVIAGETDPKFIRRKKIADILNRKPGLRTRIENSKTNVAEHLSFCVEEDRINNVILKLAQGHAAFELGRPFLAKPRQLLWWPLSMMTYEQMESYNGPHQVEIFDEIGSRSLQRVVVAQVKLKSQNGNIHHSGFLYYPWTEVQDGRYRYQTITEPGAIRIKFVLSEFLACEVIWAE